MNITRKSLRLHIGIFGRRNSGKSSLLNAMTCQDVSIVSEHAGTTTDPVEKPMELQPIGPILFIDTAGLDDVGALGEQRVAKTKKVFDRTDLAILVASAGEWTKFEKELAAELTRREIPFVVVFNKADIAPANPVIVDELVRGKIKVVSTVAMLREGILDLQRAIIDSVPEEFVREPDLLGDIVMPGEFAILVVPIDKEAPKGRLILPQVQTIRNLLDNESYCLVVKERELACALQSLRNSPKLVVTDSQVFLKVAADVPPGVMLTSFSILFARLNGDLSEMVQGAATIDSLTDGDRVLIAEACSHHPIADDIGRVKIPRWITQYSGAKISFEHVQGRDLPGDLSEFKLVVHCGACMWNRREMLSRILCCRQAEVPITNYGLTIAYSLGIFERALEPFPWALERWHSLKSMS